jgi:hypothetical protein
VIYVIQKFHHDLLGNNFTFFIDHQALIYLVNKPIITRQITQWLLLLQAFDFKINYKLGKVHFVLNQLSHVKNGELAIGVEDKLPDTAIFLLTVDLYAILIKYLHKVYFEDDVPQEEQKRLTKNPRPYTFYKGKLYKLGLDGILWQCLSPIKANVILIKLCDGPVGGHYGISTTIKNMLIASY